MNNLCTWWYLLLYFNKLPFGKRVVIWANQSFPGIKIWGDSLTQRLPATLTYCLVSYKSLMLYAVSKENRNNKETMLQLSTKIL